MTWTATSVRGPGGGRGGLVEDPGHLAEDRPGVVRSGRRRAVALDGDRAGDEHQQSRPGGGALGDEDVPGGHLLQREVGSTARASRSRGPLWRVPGDARVGRWSAARSRSSTRAGCRAGSRATLRGWAAAVRAALTRPGAGAGRGLLLLKAAVATVLALAGRRAPARQPGTVLRADGRPARRRPHHGAFDRGQRPTGGRRRRRHEHRLAGRLARRRDVVVDGARHVRGAAHRALAAAGRPRHPGADDGAALADHGQRHRHRVHLPHDRRDGARGRGRGGGQRRRAGAHAPRRAARRPARPHHPGAGRARRHRRAACARAGTPTGRAAWYHHATDLGDRVPEVLQRRRDRPRRAPG